MQQIAPGLWTFKGLMVGRVYAIEDPDGLTLIDTSVGAAAGKIVKQLEAAGRSASSIKRILVTHAHPDHVGSLPELKARSGADVIVPAGEREVIEGKREIPRASPADLGPLARRMVPPPTILKPTRVDRALEDGETLAEVMGGLKAIATPGHAPGHMAYWQPERRILFCGDVLMRFPLVGVRLPIAAFTVDMAENIRSIKRLAELDIAILCLGHGQPIFNANATVRGMAARHG